MSSQRSAFALPSLFAQRPADWSVELTGNAQRIIFQHMTGVPIIQTDKAYVGIDPVSGRPSGQLSVLLKALSGVIETNTDFYNMARTPYVLIRHNLIDSRDGKVLMDKTQEGYKKSRGLRDHSSAQQRTDPRKGRRKTAALPG
ncbi:MAG: hypothetical protein IPK76_16100 [Lewinellaceae bacterium]|nr:hypothetical protein [Lewinellaceae bacterium]